MMEKNNAHIRDIRQNMSKHVVKTLFLLLLFMVGCLTIKPSLKTLSEENPAYVVAHRDSLLPVIAKHPEKKAHLIQAYLNLADQALAREAFSTAEKYLSSALIIDEGNPDVKYYLAMANGLQLYKKGSQSQLWDAIEQFSRASVIKPEDGLAIYWMAKGYYKKDDTDYENIIDLYTKSLERGLPATEKADAEERVDKVKKEKELMESFWN